MSVICANLNIIALTGTSLLSLKLDAHAQISSISFLHISIPLQLMKVGALVSSYSQANTARFVHNFSKSPMYLAQMNPAQRDA